METESCEIYDIGCWLSWFIEEIKAVFLELWLLILNAFAALLEYIPVPQFMLDAANANYQLPSLLLYLLDIFQFQAGLVIIVGAYTARFILRRIPFIGG